jgi:cell division protein FtsA
MDPNQIVVGLDIGTSKVAAVVAEVGGDEVSVVGLGMAPSAGLRRGVVVNLDKTVESITKAIADAELMSGTKIRNVVLGVAGDHIKSHNSRGVIAVSRSGQEISARDVDRVLEAARAVAIPMDREIIHVIPQEFTVDDQSGVRDPVGMAGVRLEAEVHIVTALATSLLNIVKCVRRAGLEVEQMVLQPIAAAKATLTEDERELGVALVDVGAGTTDIAVFHQDAIRHTAVVGLGGRNVTNDVAIGLRAPIDRAEEVKLAHGCALVSMVEQDDEVMVPGVGGREPRSVPRRLLASIIEPRMEELFSLVLRELRRTDYAEMLAAGVVLTGGGAVVPGADRLGEQIFDMPVRVARPTHVGGLSDVVSSPVHSVGIGLVRYAAEYPGAGQAGDRGVLGKIISGLRRWYDDFF